MQSVIQNSKRASKFGGIQAAVDERLRNQKQ